MADRITTKDAAAILGVKAQRVRGLINEGRLPAQRLGRDFLIDPVDLSLVANRKPGRPRGSSKDTRVRASSLRVSTGGLTPGDIVVIKSTPNTVFWRDGGYIGKSFEVKRAWNHLIYLDGMSTSINEAHLTKVDTK